MMCVNVNERGFWNFSECAAVISRFGLKASRQVEAAAAKLTEFRSRLTHKPIFFFSPHSPIDGRSFKLSVREPFVWCDRPRHDADMLWRMLKTRVAESNDVVSIWCRLLVNIICTDSSFYHSSCARWWWDDWILTIFSGLDPFQQVSLVSAAYVRTLPEIFVRIVSELQENCS